MSIQYVQVKVDTTGLFQPVSMAQGVVGIAGVATAAKGFDQRAQLFTQPLTGAPGEPYIRSVRVILINENNEPLDAASPPTPLGGPANARVNSLGQQSTTTNKVAVKGLKINAKGQFVGEDTDDNKLIKTDPATNRPIKFDGTQYELTLDWFPAKEPAAQPPSNPKLGVPVDGNGRPIANIRMNDDGKFTSLDGNTEYKPDPATGYPLRPASGNQPPELITNLDFGLSQLAKSINLALVNGALRVWAYRLNQGENVDNAFTDFVNRQINIVCLSKMTDGPSITKLKDHVTNASPNDAGGGGTRPRIGVAMLPKGSPISGKTSTILADFGINWTSSRMVLVAHNSDDDVAAAVAGTIARYDPWISLVLKEVISITQSESLSDSEIEKWLDPEGLQGIAQARVNPIVDPEFLAGAGLVMGGPLAVPRTSGSSSGSLWRMTTKRSSMPRPMPIACNWPQPAR